MQFSRKATFRELQFSQVLIIWHFFQRIHTLIKFLQIDVWVFFSLHLIISFHSLPDKTDKKVFANFLFSKSLKECIVIHKINGIKRNSRHLFGQQLIDFACGEILRSYDIAFLSWSSPNKTYPIWS